MCDIQIKVAVQSDLSMIRDFLAVHFHDKEPIELSHVDKIDKVKPDENFLTDCIKSEATLVAFAGNDLIGVLLAAKIFHDEAERNLQCANEVESKKTADILRFLSFIDARADYCNRLKVSHCLHILIISIHPSYHRRGIAKKLFELCVQIGERKKFPAITIDCTNVFTSRIAESFNFVCTSTVTYDEYNKHIGEMLFIPTYPHIDIKSYAKLYNENSQS